MKKYKDIVIKPAVLLLIGLISFFVISKTMSSTEYHENSITTLNEKQENVLKLTAASATASTIITLIPGDVGTPIAEKLADFGSYFLIVLSAVLLEKYLLTITGLVAFKYLIPVGCLLLIISQFWKKRFLIQIGQKVIIFGLAISFVIPASVKVSDMIEDTYQASINASISSAQEVSMDDSVTEEAPVQTEESKTIFGKIKETFNETVSNVGTSTSDALEKAETYLNNMIEALAVMIVTSCVIPILVVLFFVWLCKMLFAIDLGVCAERLVNINKKQLTNIE